MATNSEDGWTELDQAYADCWIQLRAEPTTVLLELLDDLDAIRRYAAVMELHKRGDRRVLDRGLALCGNEEPDLRETGAALLGQLGTPEFPFKKESVPILERMLIGDSSIQVRRAAAVSLGHLEAASAVPILIKIAADADAELRANVAFALGSITELAALPTLWKLYCDPDEEVVHWAEYGLEEVVPKMLQAIPTPELLEMLCDEWWITRRESAVELGRRGEKVSFDRALELRNTENDEFRISAAYLLGELCKTDGSYWAQAVAIIEQMMLTDSSIEVRQMAAATLGSMKAVETFDSLIKMADDPSTDVRASVAEALGELGLPQAVPVLKRLSDDPDAEISYRVKKSLNMLDSEDHEPNKAIRNED